jgi:Sporulation related domain.
MRNISSLGINLLLLFNIFTLPAQAQSGNKSIFEELERSSPGKGRVEISQPSSIRDLIGIRRNSYSSGQNESMVIKTQGYRIQIFSGNLRESKDEAFRKEREIRSLYPEYRTYVTYTAPFWRLRFGDYSSHEEAFQAMQLLKGTFSEYSKEMYIVREEVNITLD